MATETWTRGKLIRPLSLWYQSRISNWPWGNWIEFVRNSRSVSGRSEVTTSERSWPKLPYRNVEDFCNRNHSGTAWERLTREEKAKWRTRFRNYKRFLEKPFNPFYHHFRGVVQSVPAYEMYLTSYSPYPTAARIKGHVASAICSDSVQDLGLPAVPESVSRSIASRLFAKAAAPNFEGHTQIGELLESVRMLRSPLAALRSGSEMFYHALVKNTRRLKGRDIQEAVSGTWLEWSFGLQPLIFGTAEIASSLVDALQPDVVAGYGSLETASTTWEDTSVLEGWYYIPSFTQFYYKRTARSGYRVNGRLRLAPRTRGPRELGARLGFNSMRGIVAQAWELMPLSFVVDWFVGVGPLLQACRPLDRAVSGGCISTTRWTEINWYTNKAQQQGSPIIHPIFSDYTIRLEETSRSASISNPGSLELGPGLFSLSQGISLAALAATPMSKLWRKLPWH